MTTPPIQNLLAVQVQDPVRANQRILIRGVNLSAMCDWVIGLKPPFSASYQESEEAGTLIRFLRIFYLGEGDNYTEFEGEQAENIQAYLMSKGTLLPLKGSERGIHSYRAAISVSSIRKAVTWVGPYKVTAQRGPTWYSDITITVQLGDTAPHLTENKKNVLESEAFLKDSGIPVETGWLPEEPEDSEDSASPS